MKFVKIHLMEKALMAILLCSWIGCATVNKTTAVKGKVSSEPMATLYIPITKTVTITKHDTIKPKRNNAEIQAYLNEQYKINADQFITPQFNRLSSVISQQADALSGFKDILTEMRKRAIRRTDSTNSIIAKDRKDYARLEQIYFDEQKKQVARNAEQINNLKTITNILLALGLMMIFAIIALTIVAKILWNRLNRLYKSFVHV